MYDVGELAESIRSGDYRGVVAVADGAVAGHIGYSWPTTGATVVEAGTTVVDPDWRGRGLMKELALALVEALVSDGAVGFIHFPTTAHQVMQRASLSTGGRETGILLAYLPPGTDDPDAEQPEAERLAVTVVYQPVVEATAQSVYLPVRFEAEILAMAAQLGLERQVAGPGETPGGESHLEASLDAPRGLERFTVGRVGEDIGTRVEAAIEGSPAGLFHVDLPLNDPGIDHAVEQLASRHFAFGAWLPGWAGHDVLRLQRIEEPSAAELAPNLLSAEAIALMDSIRSQVLGSG